jgi:hypothetical protein
MPPSRIVPTVRSLPTQLPTRPVPKVLAPAVFVGEIAIKEIKAGSILTVTTENHIYTINMNEGGKGMLMTNNTEVPNGFVVLHGSWDLELAKPCWGALQRGMGLLFAHLPDVKSATKTSVVQKITLVRKGT